MHQHFGLALGLQAVEHALHAGRLPGQHRFRQLEHVVARHVEHGGFDLGLSQFTRRVQQSQFLDLLVRGQQVAFHAVGKKLQGALALFARHHALALLGQALGNPLRQLAAFDGVDLDGDAVALQRGKPGAGFGGFVQARQHDQGEGAVVAPGRFGNLLQRHAAVLAGLARGDADLDDLLVGKQAQAAASGEHGAPVKVGTGHGVAAAFGVALGAGGGADGVGGFLLQQGLVAVQYIERRQGPLEVGGELGQGDLHGQSLSPPGGLPAAPGRRVQGFALLGL